MKMLCLGWWLAVAAVAWGAGDDLQERETRPQTTSEPVRAVSVSRQFVVYAYDPLLPSDVCIYAERVKRQWLALLNIPDHWADPIIIVVRNRQSVEAAAPSIALEVFATELHLKYQITCLIPPRIEESVFTAAIVQALTTEMANRQLPVSGTGPARIAPIPLWLVQGCAQSILSRTDLLLKVAGRSVDAGRPARAADVLATTSLPVDDLERQLYQANAWLLTGGLFALPDGPHKLQNYILELARQSSASNAFAAVYRDSFPNERSLERWWCLNIAGRTSMVAAASLSAGETARRLDEILRTTLGREHSKRGGRVETEVTLDKLWTYYDRNWTKQLLKEKLIRLEVLRSEAHPSYRPVVEQYAEAVRLLLDQKLNRFRRTVAAADAARAAADSETRQITAYLDRIERACETPEAAGAFTNYFQAITQIESMTRQRRDPISDYLDHFDH